VVPWVQGAAAVSGGSSPAASSRAAGPAPVVDDGAVGVVDGKGWWYLASWTPKGTAGGHFQSVGAVVGSTEIALVVMDHDGQDHDYPPGADPMIAAVKAAATKLTGQG
jgi:hypothetical protein